MPCSSAPYNDFPAAFSFLVRNKILAQKHLTPQIFLLYLTVRRYCLYNPIWFLIGSSCESQLANATKMPSRSEVGATATLAAFKRKLLSIWLTVFQFLIFFWSCLVTWRFVIGPTVTYLVNLRVCYLIAFSVFLLILDQLIESNWVPLLSPLASNSEL